MTGQKAVRCEYVIGLLRAFEVGTTNLPAGEVTILDLEKDAADAAKDQGGRDLGQRAILKLIEPCGRCDSGGFIHPKQQASNTPCYLEISSRKS